MTHRSFPTYEKIKCGEIMNVIFLIFICLLLVLLLGIVCGAVGFAVGMSINSRQREKPPATELTEKQKREIARKQHEYNNFLSYNGTEQDDRV